MRRAALWSLVLLVLVASAPADAQTLPTDNVCGPIAATVVAPGALAVGESGTATLTVTNDGEVPVRASASLDIQDPSWEFDAGAGREVVIPAGGSQAFTFTVTPLEGASGEVVANFLANGRCESPSGGLACPADQCAVSDNASVRLATREAEGIRIPGLDAFDFPPEYLVASLVLLGLVGAFVVLMRRPARGLSADCPEPMKLIRPGRGASFPIELRNPGSEAVTAQLEVGSVPDGWSAFMPLPDVQLAPRESRSLFLMVRAPEEAAPGETVDVELSVRSPQRPQQPTYVRVRAEVNDTAGSVPIG